jgi:hypothetical protein
MAKGSSKYKHPPMSPRGRALEALSGHGGNAAGDAYQTYQQVGFEDVPAMYDSMAGVPKALTRGDSKPDFNGSPFTAKATTSTGNTSPVPYITGKE